MISEYFRRVSYDGPTEPTLDALTALVAAHNRSIPFENLDPLMGTPVVDLSPEALVDKLVRRQRGGYCFEQNGVMAHVLSQLGFGVDVLGGRVVWMSDGDELPAQTHQALAVSVPGEDGRYLVDVGFGGQTLDLPDPPRARHRAADPPRAVPDPRAWRRAGAGERDPWQVGAALSLQHEAVSGDRPPGRKLVCVNVSEVRLRHGALRRAHHRRRALEPAGTKSRDPRQGW